MLNQLVTSRLLRLAAISSCLKALLVHAVLPHLLLLDVRHSLEHRHHSISALLLHVHVHQLNLAEHLLIELWLSKAWFASAASDLETKAPADCTKASVATCTFSQACSCA